MIGETLGSHRIVSEIGRGGMGVVYLAEHAMIGRKVAVKLLRADVATDQVERFFNEARAAAKLHHPGLVETFDFGHHTDGSAYIVMEFLAGESLAERLEREPKLPMEFACTIARAVASALRVAHGEGIIHRDLKPGNIFLVDDPDAAGGVRVKVLDFGIAKLTRDDVPSAVMTNSGAVIGTPRYMSPEQCKNAREVDGRTDIYSLGCILYEMLLGTPPFDYDNWAELVGAHLHEEPARPTELDAAVRRDVEALLLRMIAKKVEDRFQSMQEVAGALDDVLRASGIETAASSLPAMRARLSTPPRGVRPASPTATDPTMLSPAPDSKSTPVPVAVTRPRRDPLWIAGMVALTLLLVTGGVIAVVVYNSSKEVVVIGVDQQARDDLSPALPGAIKPVEAVDAAPAPAVDAASAVTEHPRPRSADELQVERLSARFAKRRAEVARCLHGKAPGREPMIVRLSIDLAGHVTSAEVLPAEIGRTEEGQCFARVAHETEFGPQPKAVTVRVPLRIGG